jgi:hypothetical protein
MDRTELRRIRREYGFTQIEVVDKIASVQWMALRTYQRYEDGKRRIPGWIEYVMKNVVGTSNNSSGTHDKI